MGRARPRHETQADYERTAREYCASLPLEHFMEGTDQAFQRLITLMAFEQIHTLWPDFQPFNELLVQYDHGRPKQRRQVVPDNVVVVHAEALDARGSYDLPLQPARPFFVLEYVSPNNKRKDYEDSYDKYEKELKVAYFLRFYPEAQELSLFRHSGRRYVSVTPDERGRYAIPELQLELALVDGWVRYWFRGELLEMPSRIRQERDEARRERDELQAEVERLRRLLGQQGGQTEA
jgi:hypothetical protein